jgi:hypothetical protein
LTQETFTHQQHHNDQHRDCGQTLRSVDFRRGRRTAATARRGSAAVAFSTAARQADEQQAGFCRRIVVIAASIAPAPRTD